MDAQLGLLEAVAHAQFHRRVEDRIAAENQQQVHRARVQILHQILQRSQLIHRIGFDRIGVEHRLADVAQLRVHDVRQRVHDRRLLLAGDHEAGALVVLQVARDRAEPLVDIVVLARLRTVARRRARSASAQANSSISPARSGRRWSALVPVGVGIGSTTYSRFIVVVAARARGGARRTGARSAGCRRRTPGNRNPAKRPRWRC